MKEFGARRFAVIGVGLVVAVSACQGAGASPTPTATLLPSASEAAEPSPSPTPTDAATGPAAIEAPREVEAGAEFEVAWTGPNADGDYITIVPAGATEWTFTDPYFNTTVGSPSTLVAPVKSGPYALWYVAGSDESILVRLAITVTPFEGDLLGPDEIAAGTPFDVAWNGPDGPGDYIAIVPLGASQWTSADDYFDTLEGNPGELIAHIEPGDYEIWYVTGSGSIQSRRPITVTPMQITLEAPDQVNAEADFEVTWTGPDAQGDYITIVRAGSEPGDYLDYASTYEGSPLTLTAPGAAGTYEIWYASDRVPDAISTFESIPIRVN